jgi:hypothetical protein
LLALQAAALLAAGCAVPHNYRLIEQGDGRLLIPPGVKNADTPTRKLTLAVQPGAGVCPDAAGLQARPAGHRLRVTVSAVDLAKQPPGSAADWAARAEAQGCVAGGAGLFIASRVLESIPIDPAAAFRLLRSRAVTRRSVELLPEQRLQVVIPIQRADAKPDAPLGEIVSVTGHGSTLDVGVKVAEGLLGFETSWYAVRPRHEGPGARIELTSVERTIQGKKELASAPAANYFRFAQTARYFRLFYKADEGSDVITAEMVLATATLPEMDALTKAVDADSAACLKAGDEACSVIPLHSAVNSYIGVTVNGAAMAVPAWATVESAIRAAGGDPAIAFNTLKVLRLYLGRSVPVEFDRSAKSILGLILNGGESITW